MQFVYETFFGKRFSTFLAVLESKYSGDSTSDSMALTEAIDDLYQIYIENVVKKVNQNFADSFKKI
jgi:hypothetical protein